MSTDALNSEFLTVPGSTPFPPHVWQSEAIASFEGRMLDPEDKFPCIFGVDAVVRKTLRYGFIDSGSHAEQLSATLRSFTSICEELGRRTSLVVFFESWNAPEETHESYYQEFWKLLERTSSFDETPWPSEYSADTDDSTFEYCFNGVPMFVVVNTPLHTARRSRQFERVAITFQPRFVFDDIKHGTKPGDNARKVIRGRIDEYDTAPLTAMLGNFGEETNSEWRQYYLDDGQDVIARGKCPISFVTRKESEMTETMIIQEPELGIAEAAAKFLPTQGGIELQRDAPGKVHSWHSHSVHETLVVLSGYMVVEYAAHGGGPETVTEDKATAGTRIELPAGTIHQSTAGEQGCVYFIIPEGGKAAHTVSHGDFLSGAR
ncbi:YqcI/YcgG family protein [Streptomyces sp. NPDC048337]|uniref:YqcI/YcgG family protein n=1 Tax=Streptomyces sp. NPDC048337 TaxID=3365535 RepID=UPI0037150135